jgi:hypothetical protein
VKKNPNIFKNLTVILPIINETYSINKTVDILLKNNFSEIKKILFVLHKDKTKKLSKSICKKFVFNDKKRFKILYQKKKFLGGAMQDAFKQINTSHCLMMSSDLETDPYSVKKMIKFSKKNPDKIITASRWIKKKQFKNYGQIKIFANYIFQSIFSFLYRVKCTDLTFGFRIFPANVIKKIKWEMINHSFLFESIIKPIKKGVGVVEIDSSWKKRKEGKTNNIFMNYFWYVYIGIKVLLNKN